MCMCTIDSDIFSGRIFRGLITGSFLASKISQSRVSVCMCTRMPGRKGPREYAKIGRLRGSPRSNARLR